LAAATFAPRNAVSKIIVLAELIVSEVGYKGQLVFDITKPDGTPRKLLDISKIKNLGWNSKISLNEGILKTIIEYKNETKQ
jgi:GDP-L-fucose synthase